MPAEASPFVSAYTVRTLDLDVLSLRDHLIDDTFIEVFANVLTEKVAFALILDQRRINGKDNAKIGWHVHPWDDPNTHHPCDPVSFEALTA